MTSNPGRALRRHEVVVEGVLESLLRVSSTLKHCDACPGKVRKGERYVRVIRKSPKSGEKMTEMFHVSCFLEEFTEWEAPK